MSHDDDQDDTTYKVVVNHEEQYSIWPEGREEPPGWRSVGMAGTKQECLAHIEEVWTDMRPLSLRKAMEALEKKQADEPEALETDPAPADPRDNLVEYLSTGEHPVEVRVPKSSTFRDRMELGFIHVRFTDTRGGTELGFSVNREHTDTSRANLDEPSGELRLAGTLKLNGVRVMCVADLDLTTLAGTGHLEVLDT
jgi:uncharacterized protein YbdZ (MbtH family)